jgi:ABC-2 type transport system ATP-binding protein
MTDDLAIETMALTKRFGARAALTDVDLRVRRGCAFGFLGPNGAGKTTLVRTLLGLTPASGGRMRLLGHDVPTDRRSALARVGAVVEEPRFHPFLTGRENLRIVAAVRAPEAHDRIPAALERVGLAARADERVARYSLGMRQRLGIARCLLTDPELLILDEPTNGLDPAGIREFRAFVRELVAEGRTVLLSSHLLDEVEKICDAVAIVDHGRVVVQGSLAELKGDRQTILIGSSEGVRVQALLAAHPIVRSVATTPAGIRVVVRPDSPVTGEDAAAELNRFLVQAGLAIHRVEPARASLEERFLEITSRLGAAA